MAICIALPKFSIEIFNRHGLNFINYIIECLQIYIGAWSPYLYIPNVKLMHHQSLPQKEIQLIHISFFANDGILKGYNTGLRLILCTLYLLSHALSLPAIVNTFKNLNFVNACYKYTTQKGYLHLSVYKDSLS